MKNREDAQKMLETITNLYKDQIEKYDLEELGKIDLSDPTIKVEIRNVLRKGGSLQVTLPKEVTKYLDLSPGDLLAFITRKHVECIYINKIFSLSDGKRTYALREQKG